MSGKRKLAQFAAIKTFENVIEIPYDEAYNKEHPLKGNWNAEVFKNDHPIVLELGCGKGEYSIGLAQHYPKHNFIGVDIKGARMWRGAKTALDENINNVQFLRTRIEFIDSFFNPNEVSEIWITFPDPQPRESREKKRLTSPRFIEKYLKFLKADGIIHLKTDAKNLYEYTDEVWRDLGFELLISTGQLYHDLNKLEVEDVEKAILNIPTFYEKKFKEKGHEISYIKMRPSKNE